MDVIGTKKTKILENFQDFLKVDLEIVLFETQNVKFTLQSSQFTFVGAHQQSPAQLRKAKFRLVRELDSSFWMDFRKIPSAWVGRSQ